MSMNGNHGNPGYLHTIVAVVQDHPGVLNRIASLFRRRGFNIASLAVGQSEIPGLSRMTFVVVTDQIAQVDQVTKQLRKVIEVVKVTNLTGESIVARELALVKVRATNAATRAEIIQVVELFRAKIVDVGADSLIIEITGDEEKIESIMTLVRGFGIIEVMRTGRVAVTRGKKAPLKPLPQTKNSPQLEAQALSAAHD
ncbi:MAG: ilvN [Dehalococcoidia bacterium]|nr:ilvN [Dehalococcoidia bacterium]